MIDSVPVHPRILAHVESLGLSLDRVRARAGLEGRELSVVTTEQFFALWRAIDAEAQRPELGVLLGEGALDGGYSVVSSAALHAPDLRGALDTYARYKRLTCPEQVEIVVERGEAAVRFHWILASSDAPRLLVDSSFASFVATARRGTAGKVAPLRIELARRAEHASVLREHFRCPITFGASLDRIVFDEAALAVPFVTADAAAFSRLVPGLEAELVGRARARSLRDDVRVAIARTVSSGARPSVERVAARLRVSTRTLQRRLGEERTSYQEQLDEVRRTSARRLLANTELDPTDIAFLLGFEEPNSFARAFRAWERVTPTRFRERVQRR